MKFKLTVILSTLLFIIGCGNRYGFDFKQEWDWNTLKRQTDDPQTLKQIDDLREKMSLSDAHFLLKNLSQLKNPEDIYQLSAIEKAQNDSGGGFYGFIPNFFNDAKKVPVPTDFSGLISCAQYLNNVKLRIHRINARSNFQINPKFKKRKIADIPPDKIHPGLEIKVSTDAIMDVLNHYLARNLSKKDAIEIANNPTFQQMLINRKEVGYIPKPLPDEKDLATFIYQAAQNDPVATIWRWLNPWNCFGFAEIYNNDSSYYAICSELNQNAEKIAAAVNAKLSIYLPEDFKFQEQIDFGVNWGILSWGTENRVGLNIILVKNDYPLIIRQASSQTFRKIQQKIMRDTHNISSQDVHIKDIVGSRYSNIYDKLFYEVLAQILIEGTASYVGGKKDSGVIIDGIKEGRDLLNQVYYSLYEDVNIRTVRVCENEGFSINGPFVAIGYSITQKLVKKYGPEIIYSVLADNYLDFYLKYLDIEDTFHGKKLKIFDPETKNKIRELSLK